MTAPRPSSVRYTSEPPALRVWFGIESEEPPFARDDHADLLAMAQRMLAQREKRFPAMVARGEISADAAQAQIEAFAAIVADWRWIITGEGTPASLASLQARCDALDQSIRTIADLAREAGGFSTDLAAQAHLVIAMRWHADPANQSHAIARLNHELRAGTFFAQALPHAA